MSIANLSSGWGVIKDHRGLWILGFTWSIGVISSVNELWTLRDGLNMCINLNLQVVEIWIDVKAVLDWDTDTYNNTLSHVYLLSWITGTSHIHTLDLWSIVFLRLANELARKWHYLQQDLVVFNSSLVNVYILLYYDMVGIYYESPCPKSFFIFFLFFIFWLIQ